jgi:outer membrane receptor protein involved in Fe transport
VDSISTDSDSVYSYAHFDFASRVTVSFGASVEALEGERTDVDHQVNPKAGIIWQPRSGTTIRASAFRTLHRAFSRQDIQPRLEPTQVSGFNQFLAGDEGEDVWRYGIGLDQAFSRDLYAGVELSQRDIVVPFLADVPGLGLQVFEAEEEESTIRSYVYWTPSARLALSAEYQYEDFENDPNFAPEGFIELETQRLPLQLSYFGVTGFAVGLGATYVKQEGEFQQYVPPFLTYNDQDEFWVLDAFARYRLARRRGVISLTVENLADEEFRYQDTDPANPRIFPERLATLRVTFAF